MKNEMNAKTKAYRYIGIAAALLLIAAVFVGSAAAVDCSVGNQTALKEAVNSLKDNPTVTIKLTESFDVTNKDCVKEMAQTLIDVFYTQKKPKTLKVIFNGKTITVKKNDHSVAVTGTGNCDYTIKRQDNMTVMYPTEWETQTINNLEQLVQLKRETTGKLSVTATYGSSYTVSYKEIAAIYGGFMENPTDRLEWEPTHFVYFAADGGNLMIDNLTYSIESIQGYQGVIASKTGDAIKVASPDDTSKYFVKLLLTDKTVIEGTKIKFLANGNVKELTAKVEDSSATVTYTPQNESKKEATVYLTSVTGEYKSGFKDVKGTAELGSNLEITHVLPIPSFVTEANLWLNNYTLSTTKDKYFDYKGNAAMVTVMSPGFIEKVGKGDYTSQFDKADYYKGKTLNYRLTNPYWEFYVTTGGGGGGGGGGSPTIPTYTPGVTPTPTQTWTPIDPSQTGVQPSQSPKSPMPIFGILAGLGAAALAGVVLRRK